jgi:O-antigen ligase
MGLGSLIFFGLVAAGSLWNSGLGMLGRMKDLAAPNLRDVLWAKCIEYIASAPLLGIGPMQFAANQHNQFAHPHNWLLQVAAEWGIPAAVLLCAAGYLIWQTSKQELVARPSDGAVDVLLLGSLVALFYGLLDGNYVMPISQTAVALTFGALLGVKAAGQRHSAMVGRSAPLFTVLVLSSATLGAMTLFTATCQSKTVEQLIQLQGFENLAPRFWLDGWIPFCR